jgi:RNA polymerase sigma-70 factor (ECF subfamily)
MTEEETAWISRAKRGDQRSFELLVERFMGRATAVAMGYVGNRADALDLAQEAFYRVYKSLDRFRDGEPFAPWFFRILRNACITYLEKYRKPGHRSLSGDPERDIPDYEIPDESLTPEVLVDRDEAKVELWKAIARLPLKHREILLLRHFEDLEYARIAEVLSIPIGTVMSRLFHARRKLKDEMVKGGYLG